MRNILVCGSIILFLSGCNLAPQYIRPEAPVPGQWPTGPAYKETKADNGTSAVSDIGWREFFADERLQNVIKMALENNRNLRIAASNIERARAIYKVQRADLFPTVNVSAIASKERVPGIISGTGHHETVKLDNANIGISAWEMDFFGRIRNLTEQALEQYFGTEQARKSAQISLVAEVAYAYLTLAADRELLKLAEDTFVTQQASYELIESRYKKGISTEIDLRQVQTRVDAARVDIARFTSRVAEDENLLNLLVGSPVTRELLPCDLGSVTPMKDIAADLPSEVLQQRPDILQAESQLKGANANIGAARAAFFPRITLTTGIGTTSN